MFPYVKSHLACKLGGKKEREEREICLQWFCLTLSTITLYCYLRWRTIVISLLSLSLKIVATPLYLHFSVPEDKRQIQPYTLSIKLTLPLPSPMTSHTWQVRGQNWQWWRSEVTGCRQVFQCSTAIACLTQTRQGFWVGYDVPARHFSSHCLASPKGCFWLRYWPILSLWRKVV